MTTVLMDLESSPDRLAYSLAVANVLDQAIRVYWYCLQSSRAQGEPDVAASFRRDLRRHLALRRAAKRLLETGCGPSALTQGEVAVSLGTAPEHPVSSPSEASR